MTSMKRHLLYFSIGCLAMAMVAAAADHDKDPIPTVEKVGSGVIEALRSKGEAYVVIAFEMPHPLQGRNIGLVQRKKEIAALQDRLLSRLYDSEYKQRHTYQAIPALAGKVLSEAALAKLAANPHVIRVDLDVGGRAALSTSVPRIGANRWHEQGITGNNVVVALLDTGLDTDHSDLADDLIHQECFLDTNGIIDGIGGCPNGSDRQSGPGAAEDDDISGHGTVITGIITSKGVSSPVGVAPGAQIIAIKVIDEEGIIHFTSEILAALDFIINERPDVDVINMSFGTEALFRGHCDNALAFTMMAAEAIDILRARGTIVFAASGNEASVTRLTAPACLSNVVSVGAIDEFDRVALFTNSSSALDLLAPGIDITSTGLGNGIATRSGTSFAVPHAVGCTALLIERGTTVFPFQIRTLLRSSPVLVTDPGNGLVFPRLDCSPATTSVCMIDGGFEGIASRGFVSAARSDGPEAERDRGFSVAFVLTSPQRVFIRTNFIEGEPGTQNVGDPLLKVQRLGGPLLDENDDWTSHPMAAQIQERLNRSPEPMSDLDSGMVLDLAPGVYVAVVVKRDSSNVSGQVVLRADIACQ